MSDLLLEENKLWSIAVVRTAFVEKVDSRLQAVQDNPFGTKGFKVENIRV